MAGRPPVCPWSSDGHNAPELVPRAAVADCIRARPRADARRGSVAPLRARPRLGTAALIAVSLFALADLSAPGSIPAGAAALLASLLLVLRLASWRLAAVLDDPLVWSLHLGYAWVPIGLAALGLSAFGLGLPRTLGVHLLTAGAMGGMILAVMSRVALGHTGRPLAAPAWMPLAYGLVALGALLRSVGPLLWPDSVLTALALSALPWSGAFAIFLGVYAPILTSPRVDGRPG